MGKRKSRKKVVTKKKKVSGLSSQFKCPFCEHDRCVECTIKNEIGRANCRMCGESYQTIATRLTQPIDVYCEWLDACTEEAKNDEIHYASISRTSISGSAVRVATQSATETKEQDVTHEQALDIGDEDEDDFF